MCRTLNDKMGGRIRSAKHRDKLNNEENNGEYHPPLKKIKTIQVKILFDMKLFYYYFYFIN